MPNKEVTLRLGNYCPIIVEHVSQGDTDWTWVFQVVDDHGQIYAPVVRYAILAGNKPDGHAFAYLCTKDGDTYKLPPSAYDIQMTAAAGDVRAELRLLGSNGKGLGSCNFTIRVEEGPEGTVTVASDSSLPAYLTILNKIGTIPDDVAGYITEWLETHISGGQGVVVDNTLTVQGAAADAKAAGDRLKALEDATIETDATLTIEGAAADAKAVGAVLFDFDESTYTNPDTGSVSTNRFGYFCRNENVYEIEIQPILSTGTSYDWELYKTTDGQPFASGASFVKVSEGNASTQEPLVLPFSPASIVCIKNANLRFCHIESSNNAELVLVQDRSSIFPNYVFAGAYTLRTKSEKYQPDTTLSKAGKFADAAAVGNVLFDSSTEKGTVSYSGSGANTGEWGVFFPDDETIIGLKYKPYWSAESGSCPWKLYRTTDGSNVSLGKSLTPVAGGTVEVGETIELDTFGPQYILSLVTSNSTPRVHCLSSTGTYAKLGSISSNYLASRDYNLAMSGEFELTRKVPKWETVVKNHWNGKSWYAYGTSLTSTSQGKYAKYVAQISGLMLNNFGIGGGGIISNRNIYNRLMDNTDGKVNADLITIEVGANDAGSPLGTPLDTNNTTFCGSLNVCIKNILTNCPKAQVVIMDSTRSRTENGTNVDIDQRTSGGFDYLQCAEAIRQVAEINGVYYIPLASGLGMGIYRMQSSDLYNVDSIHHTELGGYNLAQGVWSYLKNIPLWYSEMPTE